MSFRGLFVIVAFAGSLWPQTTKPRDPMPAALDCTLKRGEQWVDKSLYADGKIRYSYLYSPRSGDLYVAYWNGSKTAGKLVQYQLKGQRCSILNDAWIISVKGNLDLQDAMGGVYTYTELKKRLAILKEQPVREIEISDVHRGSSVCTSPLTGR